MDSQVNFQTNRVLGARQSVVDCPEQEDKFYSVEPADVFASMLFGWVGLQPVCGSFPVPS